MVPLSIAHMYNNYVHNFLHVVALVFLFFCIGKQSIVFTAYSIAHTVICDIFICVKNFHVTKLYLFPKVAIHTHKFSVRKYFNDENNANYSIFHFSAVSLLRYSHTHIHSMYM